MTTTPPPLRPHVAARPDSSPKPSVSQPRAHDQRSLVARIEARTGSLDQVLRLCAAGLAIRSDEPAAESIGVDATTGERWYDEARRLAAAGRHDESAPAALLLCALWPRQARFSYLAGRSLQRLGEATEAATLFEASLRAGRHALTALRLGQCLRATRPADARSAFKTCLLLCAQDARLAPVAQAARAALQALMPAPARSLPAFGPTGA